jgi:hypothetical protein
VSSTPTWRVAAPRTVEVPVVVIEVCVFVVYGRAAVGREVLVARCLAAMDIDFAFVVQRRHEVHIPGGRASAVGLNDLCQEISGVIQVLVEECLTSVSILRHPVQEVSKGRLGWRRNKWA